MSRYIDADAVKEALKQNTPQYMRGEVLATVNVQPYIDLVRCGECRCRNENCGMGEHKWCEKLNMSTTPNDFCSYGERKESE